MPKTATYSNSGVDIKAGEDAVELIQSAVRRTHSPRVISRFNSFAGMFKLDYNESIFKKNYKEPVLVACTDGVGTKVKLAIELKKLKTIGIDCVAMNVNDLLVQGAEPLFFLDYLGLDKQIPKRTLEIVEGIATGCELSGCSLIGGECAEMPSIYSKGDFDLAGFTVGIVEFSKVIDGSRVRPGDKILGLSSSGFHSNGYSLIRNILKKENVNLNSIFPKIDTSKNLGDLLLEPTRIYVKSVLNILKRYRVKRPISGMSHITGGGLAGNLVRGLPKNCDAIIDKKSWKVPPIFGWLKKTGSISSAEMESVFNLGIGFVLIVRPSFSSSIATQLEKSGEQVYEIGEIRPGSGKVRFTHRVTK